MLHSAANKAQAEARKHSLSQRRSWAAKAASGGGKLGHHAWTTEAVAHVVEDDEGSWSADRTTSSRSSTNRGIRIGKEGLPCGLSQQSLPFLRSVRSLYEIIFQRNHASHRQLPLLKPCFLVALLVFCEALVKRVKPCLGRRRSQPQFSPPSRAVASCGCACSLRRRHGFRRVRRLQKPRSPVARVMQYKREASGAESDHGYKARSTRYQKNCYKECTTFSRKVFPELRFASCAKTRVVEKRLPMGDHFRRAKNNPMMFHVFFHWFVFLSHIVAVKENHRRDIFEGSGQLCCHSATSSCQGCVPSTTQVTCVAFRSSSLPQQAHFFHDSFCLQSVHFQSDGIEDHSFLRLLESVTV